MRIVLVETSLSENGGLRVSLEYARQWQAAGSAVDVAVLKSGVQGAVAAVDPTLGLAELTPAGVRFRTAWAGALVELVRRARRADVVVSGAEVGLCLLFGYAAARLAGKPFVVHVQADIEESVQTWVPKPLRWLTRWILSRADAAICVAQSVADAVVATGLPPARAHLVGVGVDVATVRRRAGVDGPRVWDDRSGPPLVVGLGRLSPQKDFALLLRAHARVKAAGVDHRLLIAGEGAARPELEKLVADLGIGDSVHLPGFVDNPYALTGSADLFVLSSRSEGMPLTLIEALAVGVPVISTRCGSGPGMVLADGEFGDLVPVGSEEELAGAIERNLRDPGPIRARAAAGPRRALDFDITRSARTAQEVMTRVTGQVRAGRSAGLRGRLVRRRADDMPRLSGGEPG